MCKKNAFDYFEEFFFIFGKFSNLADYLRKFAFASKGLLEKLLENIILQKRGGEDEVNLIIIIHM